MSQTITAIYENGALWPIAPLDLPEQSQVEIEVKQITAPEAEELDERSRIHQALVAAGLALEHPVNPQPASPLSAEERERIGRVFAVGKPLSEIIIEEREGR
ncbi:MAG: antitoxin family protein [Acidobacteria bacterium]|nr:antitoxin family protein [Acidobacteriota bacterium]